VSAISWVYLAAFLIYVGLAVTVVARNPRAALNWFCFAFLLCFALWAFEDIFHHLHPMIGTSQARFFANIGSVGGYSFASAFALFTLALTGKRRHLRRWYIYVPLAGLPLVCIVAQWTGGGLPVKPGTFGWIVDWTPSIWTVLYPAYYAGFMLAALAMIFQYRRSSTEVRVRRQANVVFWTALISLVLGTFGDVVLAELFPDRLPELAGATGVIWALGLAVGMTRYGLMPLTIHAAADEIIATMIDGLLLLRPDGRIAIVNQSFLDMLGYRRDEILDRPAAALFDPADEFTEAHHRVINEVPIGRLEFRARARNGTTLTLAVSARVMPGRQGIRPGSVWVLRDITRQKRAEQRLRESEEQYRNLVERAMDGIVILQDRVIVYANERAASMVGTAPGGLLGMPFAQYIHPDAAHEMTRLYQRRLAGEAVPATYELTLQFRDGRQLPVEISVGVIHYRGQPADLLIFRDISARKQAEAEIRSKTEELEQLNRALHEERRKLLGGGDNK
jgi:PAS domain S-box-containing protein